MPDPYVLKDAIIHPRLIKKRPENSLNLPFKVAEKNPYTIS